MIEQKTNNTRSIKLRVRNGKRRNNREGNFPTFIKKIKKSKREMKKSSSPSNKSEGSSSGDNDNVSQSDALEPIPIWSFTNDNSIQLTFITPSSINGASNENDSSTVASTSAASTSSTTEAAGSSSPSNGTSTNSSNGLSPSRKEQIISNVKQNPLNTINQGLPSIIRVGCTTALDKYSEGQGICGLHNLGNTCYLNAVLQALSSCPPITHLSRMRCGWEFALPVRHRSLHRSEFQERRYQFADNLLLLVETMWSGKDKALVPRQVARCVIDIVPEFNAYGQQDAQEAMNYILNNLHEEISAPVPPECHPAREFLVLFEKEMVELYYKYKQDNKNKGNSKNSPQIQQQQASSSTKNSKPILQGGSMSKGIKSRLKNAKAAPAKQKPSSTASESSSSVAGTGLDMSSNEQQQQQDQDEDDTASLQQETSDPNEEPKVRQVHSLYEQSVVSDAFSTFLAQKIVCSHCGFTSQQLEEYLEMSVALPNKAQIKELRDDGNGESSSSGIMSYFKGWLGMGSNGLQLDDCLRAFFSKEKLDGQNQYHCDNCKTKRDAVKSVNLAHAPQILCVHLKRFNKVNGWGLGNTKNTTMVNFPVDGLDMSPYLHEVTQKAGGNSSQCIYDLISVVKHTGTVNRGHYIANCRNMVNNKWYEYDDELRYEIAADSLQTSDVYLLLYSKRPTKANLENKIALEEALKTPIPAQINNADQELFYVPNYWISQWKSLSNPGLVHVFVLFFLHLMKRYLT